jgi:hypothetical protein
MAKGTFTAISCGLIAALTIIGSAQAQTTPAAAIYPVKFVCGTQAPIRGQTAPAEPPVKPGNYATVINIEALVNDVQVASIVSVANSTSKPVSGPGFGLLVNQTRDITCADISKAIGTSAPFITGFINISPANALTVTAVYTSQGCTFALPGILPIPPVCSGPTSIEVVPQQSVLPPLGGGIGN